MSRLLCALLVSVLVTGAGGASAQSLFDKVGSGVSKAGNAVKKGLNSAGETIDSTMELATNEGSPAESRARIDQMASESLTRLYAQEPSAAELMAQSAGYAVFDTRKASLLGVHAGFGRGVAVSRETDQRTYMDMGTGGVGIDFGLGGFDSQVVFLFETADGFEDFVVNGYDATAQTDMMFGDQKEDAALRFVDGRQVYVLTGKGWKVGGALAGTKYWRNKKLNTYN